MYLGALLRLLGNPGFNRLVKPLLKQHIFFSAMLGEKGGFYMTIEWTL